MSKKPDIPSHVWWSVGIDPSDPANWALMSRVAEEILLSLYGEESSSA